MLIALLAAILVVVFGGALWAGKRWIKRHPSANGATQVITPTGFVLFGCQVLLLIVGFAARELEPHGPLGEFLGTPAGVVAYLVCLLVGVSIAGHALRRLGYPVFRVRGRGTNKLKR